VTGLRRMGAPARDRIRLLLGPYSTLTIVAMDRSALRLGGGRTCRRGTQAPLRVPHRRRGDKG